ncbi:MAG: leucine-rich repeat protein [Lachnospiraceae bacterium]|nr:leucine-rich repeat protein [Lachnospiraceae bacterium]
MNVLYSQKTVGDVKLPEGWVWNEADKATALPLEEEVRVTATYNGADKGNYVTESIEITLIRKDCAHEESDIRYTSEGEKAPTCTETGIGHTECTKCQEPMQTNVTVEATGHIGETEVKDAKAATCAEEGYTGDTYCKDCGAKIVTGTKMDKSTAHTWDNGVVTKEATATEKGEKTYTCSVCKTTKKEEIPALGAPEVGTTNTSDDGKATYKVTTSNLTNGTVTYVAPTNKKATTVTIPDTVVMDGVTYKVTSVEKKAFKNNKKIKKVTIGKNVSKIGSKAFYGCSKLKTLTIKSSKLTTKKRAI